MRNFLSAIIAAAAVAGIVAFISEPIVGDNRGIPQSGVSAISQPAVKGDRLDLRPAEGCLLLRDSANDHGDCVRSRAKSTPRPLEVRIGFVDRRLIELSFLFVAA